MELDFTFDELLKAVWELAMRSLATLLPVLAALVIGGMAADYYLGESTWIVLAVSIGQFVISYFLVKGLAVHSGLIEKGAAGPGFAAYFGVSFVMGLGTGLGFLLLFIPGVVLTIRWLLAFAVLFSEEGGWSVTSPLGKSWDMTGKVFWKLLTAYLFSIVLILASLFAYGYMPLTGEAPALIAALFAANLASGLSLVYNLVLGFAAFLLLHNDREELAKVFS